MKYSLFFLSFCILGKAFSQNKGPVNFVNVVQGIVKDAGTQKPVQGATIRIACQDCGDTAKGSKMAIVTDAAGFYQFKKFVCPKACNSFAVTAGKKNYLDDLQFSSDWTPETQVTTGKPVVIDFNLFINPNKSSGSGMPVVLKGKLLKGDKVKTPVTFQKLHLKDEKETILQSAVTDEYGDFSFSNVDANGGYRLELEKNPSLKNEKVFLAKQNGLIIGECKMNSPEVFSFRLLPGDAVKLGLIEEKDEPLDIMNDFMKSVKKEITVMDNIYYETAKWDITVQAAERLDKVIAALKENPKVKVEIYAHTDARGDAQANLDLSEKRAKSAVNYIVSKGIEATRVTGKGFGETKILNRCTEGIKCSEAEYKLNRRTEFKFKKD